MDCSHLSFPVLLLLFVMFSFYLFLVSVKFLVHLKKKKFWTSFFSFFLSFLCNSDIHPLFSHSCSFPSLFTFSSDFLWRIWRRLGIHRADKERGDDVTADMIHQHLLWSKNTHHRAHTVSLQLHSAFVSNSMHYWDGPAFTQVGLMGMQGYMLLDRNWATLMC